MPLKKELSCSQPKLWSFKIGRSQNYFYCSQLVDKQGDKCENCMVYIAQMHCR